MSNNAIKEKLQSLINVNIEVLGYRAACNQPTTADYLAAYKNAISDFNKWLDETESPAPQSIKEGEVVYVPIEIKEGCELPVIGDEEIFIASKRGSLGINGYSVIGRLNEDGKTYSAWSHGKQYSNFDLNQDFHIITHWLKPITILSSSNKRIYLCLHKMGEWSVRLISGTHDNEEQAMRAKEFLIKEMGGQAVKKDFAIVTIARFDEQHKLKSV